MAAPAGRETNYVADIDGTQTKKPFFYTNYEKEDIDGTKSKEPYARRFAGKPDSFDVRDIEGARPRTNMFRTSRNVDPLNPEYELPSFEPIKYEEPRFIRDSFNVDDIWGTKPKISRKSKTRNSFDVKDIEGAQSGWKTDHKNLLAKMRDINMGTRRDSFDVRDIISKGFESKRETDPLRPVYEINGQVVRDCPYSSVPKPLTRTRKNAPFFSLETSDVKGAKGGSASVFQKLRVYERSDFRETNKTSDIPGAICNTLKRGLQTKRKTNPLQPKYTFLHGDQCPTPPIQTMDILRALDHHKNPLLKKTSSRPSSASSASSKAYDHHASTVHSGRENYSARETQRNVKLSSEDQSTEKKEPHSPMSCASFRSFAKSDSSTNLQTERSTKIDGFEKIFMSRKESRGSVRFEHAKEEEEQKPIDSTRSAPSSRSSGRNSSRNRNGRRRKEHLHPDDAAEPYHRPMSACKPSHPHKKSMPRDEGTACHSYRSACNFQARRRIEKQSEINEVKDLPSW